MTLTSEQAGNAGSQDSLSNDELSILVNGDRWTGWTELEVTRSIDSAAGRFALTVPPMRGTTWPIRPGNEVSIVLGDSDTLSTGVVDRIQASTDANGRRVKVEGRDKAATLVDCSVSLDTFEWRDQTLRQIVQDLIAPFGVEIGLEDAETLERFDLFACSSTDKAWSVIEKALRLKGLLGFSMPDGRLALIRPPNGATDVDLVEGQNVISANLRWDVADRYATYRVEGQRSGSDEGWADEIISLSGEASDLEIAAIRLLTLRGEQGMTPEDCKVRAQWEATVRRARSTALDVEVIGWRTGISLQYPHPPWEVAKSTHVELPSLGIAGTLLVSRVKFTRSNKGGPVTKLELVPLDAYQPAPEKKEPDSLSGWLTTTEDNDL